MYCAYDVTLIPVMHTLWFISKTMNKSCISIQQWPTHNTKIQFD